MAITMSAKLFYFLIVLFGSISRNLADANNPASHINFVLVGATGSLAKKYLWQGLYDVFATDLAVPIRVYGGARANHDQIGKQIGEILANNVKYDSEKDRGTFAETVDYVQLKTLEHYEAFCKDTLDAAGPPHGKWSTNDDHCGTKTSGEPGCDGPASKEVGRIFYLAVPPYSYAEMAGWLHSVCRPDDSSAWIRVVLEKPYGTDATTVDSLVSRLKANFAPQELYLIDHYLGKAAAQHILPLRFANNATLETFLNNDFVERIEVVIKESEDADGRMAFYDSYGVFLDILQNHAMEMLTLLAMDLPADLSDPATVRRHKAAFLSSLLPIHPNHVIGAQYSQYLQHGRAEFKNENFTSNTPTFGAVLLRTSGNRWSGVDLFLISGKALDAKASYARVVFKNRHLTLGAPFDHDELIVSFGPRWSGCEKSGPCVVVPKSVLGGGEAVSSSWTVQGATADGRSLVLYPGEKEDRAYSVVISDLVHGRHENFVSVDGLSASWMIWNLALERLAAATTVPPLYDRADVDSLAIRLTPTGLSFVHPAMNRDKSVALTVHSEPVRLGETVVRQVVIRPSLDLMMEVVEQLLAESERVLATNSAFHVAVPGGRTPRSLFQLLAGDQRFQWSRTHFWFTDERCVAEDDVSSNFAGAQSDLFRHIAARVHPMPVQLSRGLCDPLDGGAQLYSDMLERVTSGSGLDVVLLGVGVDGHVASLFPGAGSRLETDGGDGGSSVSRVKLVEPPPGVSPALRRMSLTAEAIGSAGRVFVLVTGKEKRVVVEEILTGSRSASEFPVKGVRAVDGVTLFVDDDAYSG